MSGIAEMRCVVLDCPDPPKLAEFYSKLLNWPVVSVEDDWVEIGDGASPMKLAFQLAPDYQPPVWPSSDRPQQFHIDVTVLDMDDAEAQVIEIGAVKADYQPSEDGQFRVFLDPVGHPFCLCRD